MTSAVDTSEMVVVHNAFRREFGEAPALIRAVGVGDRSHAAVVGAHLQLLLELLHQHHDGEDRLLWPKLRARVGSEQQPAIDLMEQHHAAIHVEVTQATAVLGRWRTFAHQRDREPLADCFERFSGLLDEHLATEEQQVLPLAASCLTQAEWDQLGAQGSGPSSRTCDGRHGCCCPGRPRAPTPGTPAGCAASRSVGRPRERWSRRAG